MAEKEGKGEEKHKSVSAKINMEEPSEELLKWAETNINEDPDKKDLLISELRDLIYEKGECTPTRTDDNFLLRFLRARHFIVKMAHKLYANYHNFIEEAPEYFKNVDLETLIEVGKKEIFSSPPIRDNLGRRMLIFKIGNWMPSEHTPTDLIQLVIFLIQVSLLEPQTQIKGAVFIVDLSGLSFEMVWYLTPTLAKHIVSIAMTSLPIRLQAVHFLYSSWIFDTAFSMIRGLIPENVRDRIFFHNDLETLYNHLEPKCLPKSLGGAIEDYTLEAWLNDVDLTDDRLQDELENLGYPAKSFIEQNKLNIG